MIDIVVDINECVSQNGGCEQSCQNTIGSHSCSCLSGYLIDNNGYNCTGLCNKYAFIWKSLYSIHLTILVIIMSS